MGLDYHHVPELIDRSAFDELARRRVRPTKFTGRYRVAPDAKIQGLHQDQKRDPRRLSVLRTLKRVPMSVSPPVRGSGGPGGTVGFPKRIR